jgi:hypothetical protein
MELQKQKKIKVVIPKFDWSDLGSSELCMIIYYYWSSGWMKWNMVIGTTPSTPL